MRRTNQPSEILMAYAAEAEKQGLISAAKEDEPKKDSKEPKDMLDEAHPDTIAWDPAYDAMNGVIENLKERQHVMMNAALNTPTAQHSNKRLVKAHQNLLNDTIKLGFLLDSYNDTELSTLADSCSEQLVKTAFPPAIIAGVALVALIGGLMYANTHPEVQGLKQDSVKALSQLQDVVSKYPQMGPVLAPITKDIQILSGMTDAFIQKSDELGVAMNEIKAATTPKDKTFKAGEFANHFFNTGKDKELKTIAGKIKDFSYSVMSLIPDAKKSLASAASKYDEDHSTLMTYFYKVKDFLVENDTDDAIDALDVLARSITQFSRFMDDQIGQLDAIKAQVQSGAVTQSPTTQSTTEEKAKPSGLDALNQDPTW